MVDVGVKRFPGGDVAREVRCRTFQCVDKQTGEDTVHTDLKGRLVSPRGSEYRYAVSDGRMAFETRDIARRPRKSSCQG